MGKYFLAWLLGVPFFVLVLIYLFFHWSLQRARDCPGAAARA